MEMIVQTFQLGSSTVVTLPKKLGIKPGQRLKMRRSKDKIILKASKKMTREEIEKFVRSLSGGLRLKMHPTPEQINQALNERYEKMLP